MRYWLIFAALILSGIAFGQTGRVNVGFIYPEAISKPLPNEFDHAHAGKEGRQGAEFAAGRMGSLAQQAGWDLRVLYASAPDGSSAVRAAQRLVEVDDVVALIGGFSDEVASALAEFASEANIPFFNVGSTARASSTSDWVFNVHPSAEVLLNGLLSSQELTGSVYAITSDNRSGSARLAVLKDVLASQEELTLAGEYFIDPSEPVLTEALKDIQEIRPDVLVLLLDWRLELDALGMLDVAVPYEPLVLTLPDSVSSTRYYYGIVRNASLKFGHGLRIAPWEHTAPGESAQDLNDRYEGRFGEPFDPVAWTSYTAIQFVYEAIEAAASAENKDWVPMLRSGDVVVDTGKDMDAVFQDDGELLQSQYLIEVHAESTGDSKLERLRDRAGFLERVPVP